MYLEEIEIKNFRLLNDVKFSLHEKTTLVVGRNNSGKSSLTELFRRLLQTSKSFSFKLEDFSLSAYEDFWKAFKLKEEDKVRVALPLIEIKLTMNYKNVITDFGALSDFIIDLNSQTTTAIIAIRYQLKKGGINSLFHDFRYNADIDEKVQKQDFFKILKEKIPKLYESVVKAIDPNNQTNEKSLDLGKLRNLLQSGFINAQRGLDDITHKNNDTLGKILTVLFDTFKPENEIIKKLKKEIEKIQKQLDGNFKEQLDKILPNLSDFGYPGLKDPKLSTYTSLDVERLLTDHTKVCYPGANGISLPESYNGLGARNLIFIFLKIYEFFQCYKEKEQEPGIHLIFIEEPEVHLHPQMQEVFIQQIGKIIKEFSNELQEKLWPVQFIISTHSSHIANRAYFESIRYFSSKQNEGNDFFETQIKDLKDLNTISDKNFLHQYMTLTRCDLLFADKAILIEGQTERLMLPKIIEKLDDQKKRLSSQYISLMEVGGAHAHIFFELLDFLELPTLIITDLDAVIKPNGEACKVSDSKTTSNQCIKKWFNNKLISPNELIVKTKEEKVKGNRYLAYQVPEKENGPCGRSFEAAFMLANLKLFELENVPENYLENEVWEKSKNLKKTEFALDYAIKNTKWIVPKYIKDGLIWLAGHSPTMINDSEFNDSKVS